MFWKFILYAVSLIIRKGFDQVLSWMEVLVQKLNNLPLYIFRSNAFFVFCHRHKLILFEKSSIIHIALSSLLWEKCFFVCEKNLFTHIALNTLLSCESCKEVTRGKLTCQTLFFWGQFWKASRDTSGRKGHDRVAKLQILVVCHVSKETTTRQKTPTNFVAAKKQKKCLVKLL